MMTLLTSLLALLGSCILVSLAVVASASPSECTPSTGGGECINHDANVLLDAAAFQKRVTSFSSNESILPLLRGTVDDILSKSSIASLVSSLPPSDFVAGAGYETNSGPYTAPKSFSGLGLPQLCTSHKERYQALLKLREKVREATEQSLGLHPGTMFVDFTQVTQKGVGGAHRAHADNCVHYFDEKSNKAKCDTTREHPYPKRVAASIVYLNDGDTGSFSEGEFYFAKQSDGSVDEKVPVESGRMMYFTSGVENLHGALPVQKRTDSDKDAEEPRRLALAMWYVTDPTLEEYVPPFRETKARTKSKWKPRRIHDPNDPTAPKELFVIPLPSNMDVDVLFRSIGTYLAASQQQTNNGSWKVIKAGEDTLQVLFKDNSAMFSLDFGVALDQDKSSSSSSSTASPTYAEASVVVERHTDGRKPASLQYQLQESVMLHSVLDALEKRIREKVEEEGSEEEDDAKEEQRRRYFASAMEEARGTLPARRA